MRNKFAHKPDFLNFNNVSLESIYKGHKVFDEVIDNYMEIEFEKYNISDGVRTNTWTPRAKFELVFLSEIETLTDKINEIKSKT
jgi:hypothetical protein